MEPPLIAGGAAFNACLLNQMPWVSSREVSRSLSKVLLRLLLVRRLEERGCLPAVWHFWPDAHTPALLFVSPRAGRRREESGEGETGEGHNTLPDFPFSLARVWRMEAHCVDFILRSLRLLELECNWTELTRPLYLTPSLDLSHSGPWDQISTFLPLFSGRVKIIEQQPKKEYEHLNQALERSYSGLLTLQTEKAAALGDRKIFPEPDS